MNELVTLNKIEQARLAIREVKTLSEIKKLVDQSEALKAYAKSAKMSAEIQADIAELNLIAERRLGEISAALESKAGKRTDLCTDNTEVTKTKLLSSTGIDIHTANKAEKLAKIDEGVFNDLLKTSKEKTRSSKEQVSKHNTYTNLGITRKQADNYQAIAKNPAAVDPLTPARRSQL